MCTYSPSHTLVRVCVCLWLGMCGRVRVYERACGRRCICVVNGPVCLIILHNSFKTKIKFDDLIEFILNRFRDRIIYTLDIISPVIIYGTS